MTSDEEECDICGARVPHKNSEPATGLNLCEECNVDFGRSKIVSCC